MVVSDIISLTGTYELIQTTEAELCEKPSINPTVANDNQLKVMI
jgi:hypothetical protein